MPLPQFTNDEQYLVNCVKSPSALGRSSSYMWGYVLGAIILAGFAAYFRSIPMMGVAFVVLCGFRIYEEHYQRRWIPLWRSIINKYEAAAISHERDRMDTAERIS